MKKQNIFLIGFMGAGKSTIAKKLSGMLAMERIEMDETIVQEQGMPISEIFDKFGEEHFRDIETELLERLDKKDGVIVSCGGGAVLRDKNTKLMKNGGKVVLVTATPETTYERVKDSTERPVLNGNMNVEYISSLMEKRRPRYEEVADLVIATDGKDSETICKEIIETM